MMNILITGGAGYIGSHVLKLLLEENQHKIVVVDNLCTGSIDAIKTLQTVGQFEFMQTDLENDTRMDEIFKAHQFDTVIHFAAFIEVLESTQNPIKYYLNNTANTIHLIELSQKYGVQKFIFSSTAATYGESENGVVSENSPQNPINPYGKSKLMTEWVLKDVALANPNFKYGILRYFNVAGASSDGLIGQNYPNATHLIKTAVQTIIGKRKKMSIFGDDYDTRDGTCMRDYIHIEDLAAAHLSVLRYLQHNDSNVFNVGYGNGFTVKEVIDCAKKVGQVDFCVDIAPRRDGDPVCLIANTDKLKNQTDWQAQHNQLEEIIQSALNWEKKL